MAPDLSSDITVVHEQNHWVVTDLDGQEVRYGYRTDAVAKARLLRLAARSRGRFPQIVVQEEDGSRAVLR